MQKYPLISIVTVLVLVGAGCFGAKTPAFNANAPVPAANQNVNAGSSDTAHVPVTKSAAFGQDASLEVGDTASFADGLRVTLAKINDSRCPKDVRCVWQGELSPVLSISGGAVGAQPKDVTLGTVRTLQTVSSGYAFALHEASATSIKVSVTKDAAAGQADARINVFSPKPGAMVTSPLTVMGEARGTWYFEASFPVELQDANGKVLALAPAQAKGDWMTEDFVPFSVTLLFPKPTTVTGALILHRDNPSGLPENDAAISVPVRFSP